MRYSLFLSLILSSALLVHAAFPIPKAPDAPDVAPEPVVPETPSDPASDPTPESGPKPEGTSPNEPNPIGPPATVPGEHPGVDPESEASDVGEHLSDILDAIISLVSLAVGGTTAAGTTITSAPSIPTAAYPCSSAEVIYNSCSSQFPGFDVSPQSAQARCLCYVGQGNYATAWAPSIFDGYVSSCNNYVQAQTQLSTLQGVGGDLGLCSSAGQVIAALSTTGAVASASTRTGSPSIPAATSAPSVQPPTMGMAIQCGIKWPLNLLVGIICGVLAL